MSLADEIKYRKYLEGRTGIKDIPLGVLQPMYQLSEFELFALLDMTRQAREHLRQKSYEAVESRLDIINDCLERKKKTEGVPVETEVRDCR